MTKLRLPAFFLLAFSLSFLISACGSDPAPGGGGGCNDASLLLDIGFTDSGLKDIGFRDSGLFDTGLRDIGPRDTGLRDTGIADTGMRDIGIRDTGIHDTGPRDTGIRDTGPRDTGARDTGLRDVGFADSGLTADSGPDAGPIGCVVLGTASSFAILAKAAVSNVPTSVIIGDVGVSPAAASYITGFALTMDATATFSTSPEITGRVFASDYSPPTPANISTSISDMEAAYTDAAGRAPDFTELGAGNIGSLTLTPGVYKWGTDLIIPTDLTLDAGGDANGVWIFQVSGSLTIAAATNVIMAGGALPNNVFWQIFGPVVLETTSHFEGTILTQTAITAFTGATLNGRMLAQTAVTLDSNAITAP